MATRIYLIRHGQSLGNKTKAFLGHTDLDLSNLGYQQAKKTAQYLTNYNIDAVYSSDLIRAYNTCNEYLRLTGKTAIKDKRLREIFAGKWEQQTFEYLSENFKSYQVWLNDLGNARPDGGESVAELEERVVAYMKELVLTNPEKSFAVFTHATVIRAFVNYAYGNNLNDIKNLNWASNSSVSIVEYENENFTVKDYSIDHFLNDLATALPKNV